MKKIIPLLCLIMASIQNFAQTAKPEIYDFKEMQFDLLWQPNEKVGLANIPKDTPVLLFVFNPDCGHCRLDAPKMASLVPQYKIPVWMVSARAKEDVSNFGNEFKLHQIQGLILLHDSANKLHDWFNFRYVPFIALIDDKGTFIKEFDKLPTAEELSEIIRTHRFMESYNK
jgi:thiol-disulfide isomerase/thioredoxin